MQRVLSIKQHGEVAVRAGQQDALVLLEGLVEEVEVRLLAELWHCIFLLALFLGAVPPLLIFRGQQFLVQFQAPSQRDLPAASRPARLCAATRCAAWASLGVLTLFTLDEILGPRDLERPQQQAELVAGPYQGLDDAGDHLAVCAAAGVLPALWRECWLSAGAR